MLSACVSDVLMTLRNTEQANQYGSRHSVCALASFLALLHPSLPTREGRGKKEAVINRPPNARLSFRRFPELCFEGWNRRFQDFCNDRHRGAIVIYASRRTALDYRADPLHLL